VTSPTASRASSPLTTSSPQPASEPAAGTDAESLADRWFRAARTCDRILSGTWPVSLRERLARLTESGVDLDGRGDQYGDGPVTVLETRVAELLGKPAAVFLPTGTMTQQVALRSWAERTGRPTVALHPRSHLEVHERRAFVTLSGLRGVWPTTQARPPTAQEVGALDEPFGTLMLELPLRDPGFLLPTWDELVATVDQARELGARVHFDGARLWETTPHFGQDLPTIAGLADSVYVSFYKTLGGISGAALAGPVDFVATARAWRHRYGGNVFQQWPAALSALDGLNTQLPRIPSYVEHARVVAEALADLPGARVHPAPPHTHQFQLWLPHPAAALNEAAFRLAEEEKVWFAGRWTDVPPTGLAMTEITVATPALSFSAADVASAGTAFLARVLDS
jgi:threonine aldolase